MCGVVAISVGCTFVGKKSDSEIVQNRAQMWVDALVNNDVPLAWRYTSPAFRQTNSAQAYTRWVGGAGNWTAGEVKDVVCENDKCVVKVQIHYSMPQFRLNNSRIIEQVWIRVDNNWWLYQK